VEKKTAKAGVRAPWPAEDILELDNMLTRRRLAVLTAGLPLLGGTVIAKPARASGPKKIRIGVPMAGLGGRPYSMGSYVSVMHVQGLLEQEFGKDGTAIDWHFFAGAGPAVNEALAEGALDFAWQGDLPEIVARSRGLETQQILVTGNRLPISVAANHQSGITTLADLKGKTVANFQGTTLQLAADRILASAGLSEGDLRMVNLDPLTAAEAAAQGQIDATFTEFTPPPRLARLLNVVFTSGPKTPVLTAQSSLIVTSSFAAAHPDALDRFALVAVKAAYWTSQEQNRSALFAIFDKTGYPPAYIQAAYGGFDLKQFSSPLWDDFATTQLARSAADCAKFGLVQTPVSVQGWVNDAPLQSALAATGLTGYWSRFAADGTTRLS
jgi:sulfonate transport system substrate-binding protein